MSKKKAEESTMEVAICREYGADLSSYLHCIDVIEDITGATLTDYGKRKMADIVATFGYSNVIVSIQIAFDYYWSADQTDDNWELAFSKIGGICYNRQKGRDE